MAGEPGRRTLTARAAAVAAGIVALALVAVLALGWPWAGDGGEPAAQPTGPSGPPPVAVLEGPGGAALAPTPEGIAAAIEELVRSDVLGGGVSAAVVDPVTGEQLFAHDPDTPIIPASAIKLVTAATVLASLGPAHQLATVAVAGQQPGEVVLVGGGDPTLAVAEAGFFPGAARLDQLAEQVAQALGDTPPSQVIVDASLFTGPAHGPWDAHISGGGFVGPVTALMTDAARVDPDPAQGQQAVARFTAPDLAAGEAFAQLLGLEPDAVTTGTAPPPPATEEVAAAPATAAPATTEPGTELGRVSSPPLLRLVEFMLAESDNVLAEALARQVAIARGEPASYEGAASAMAAVLAELGVPAGPGVTLADGSGLSRANRLTAGLLTELLAAATAGPAQPVIGGLSTGLPVAGWSGTLADRYRDRGEVAGGQPPIGAAAGVVRAKTGSLDGVNALAGLVVTADGRLLAFAVLSDTSGGLEPARQVLDEIAAALAGCGCR